MTARQDTAGRLRQTDVGALVSWKANYAAAPRIGVLRAVKQDPIGHTSMTLRIGPRDVTVVVPSSLPISVAAGPAPPQTIP